jgi:hypothetical protein
VERIAIDHEKDLGAEMESKNMYSCPVGICNGEVRFTQRSIKKNRRTRSRIVKKRQLIINSKNLEQI